MSEETYRPTDWDHDEPLPNAISVEVDDVCVRFAGPSELPEEDSVAD